MPIESSRHLTTQLTQPKRNQTMHHSQAAWNDYPECALPPPRGKKTNSPQPSQPLSPKGDICNVLALQASAGKGGQHTPESRWCPARDTPAPLPAHGLRRHEVLLVTSTWERDSTYCSSSFPSRKNVGSPEPLLTLRNIAGRGITSWKTSVS